MNSTQRYVLVFSCVLAAMIFLLNGLGIIGQVLAAKELIEHDAPASLVPFFTEQFLNSSKNTAMAGGLLFIGACVLIPDGHHRWTGRRL
jgi:hypothetical protein